MAWLVFGMNQSLDGYVDHTAFAPGPTLFRRFIEEAQGQAAPAEVGRLAFAEVGRLQRCATFLLTDLEVRRKGVKYVSIAFVPDRARWLYNPARRLTAPT